MNFLFSQTAQTKGYLKTIDCFQVAFCHAGLPCPLRQNLNFSLRFDVGVKFVDFAIGYSNAAVGPIAVQVLRADKAEAVAQAVDFDVAARVFALCGGMVAVGGVGVGNAEIFMVAAVGITVVDGVAAFRGFAVAFKLFVANRAKAECDGIGFQQVALRIVGIHFALGFVHNEFGNFAARRQGGLLQQALLPGAEAGAVADVGQAAGRVAAVPQKNIAAAEQQKNGAEQGK